MAGVGSGDGFEGRRVGDGDPDGESELGHDHGPTARRIMLGAQLRRLRESVEISRADAGYFIRGSDSKISRLELGRVRFKVRDVADLLTLYGVTDVGEREKFLALVRRSNEPGWWRSFTEVLPDWFEGYVGLEEAAARLQTYELQFVPGLLQTEEYARAVTAGGWPPVGVEEVERIVGLRVRRQKLLGRVGAPRLWAVVDESVLRRPIGGVGVLRAQLEFLLELTRSPLVRLQVVPAGVRGYAAEGSFTVMRFAEPELPDVVYIEHLTGALYLDNRLEVELYSKVFERLTVDAEAPADTRQLLTKLIAEL
jgi:hypothetical protein